MSVETEILYTPSLLLHISRSAKIVLQVNLPVFEVLYSKELWHHW